MAMLLSFSEHPLASSNTSLPEGRLLAHLLRNAASTAAEPFQSLGGSHPMDLLVSKDAYELRADAPGLSNDDINVEVHEGVLYISASSATKPLNEHATAANGKAAINAAPAAPSTPPSTPQQPQQAQQAQQPQWKVLRRERANVGQRWARAFLLPENAEADAISVDLDRGVLTVHIPLCPPPPKPAPRRIAVKSGPSSSAKPASSDQPLASS